MRKKDVPTVQSWNFSGGSHVKHERSCSLCSFGNFPGVRSLKAEVSELNVGSIVLGDQEIPDRPGRWN